MRENLPQSEDVASEELPPVVRPTRLRQLTFHGGIVDRLDFLAEEVPVALVYNGVSHAVMMASPADLADFAHGFSLSEGIIENAAEIRDIETVVHEKGIELNIELASERFHKLKERRRTIAGRTGCGLCGLESLEAVARDLPIIAAQIRVPLAIVEKALAALPSAQLHNAKAHALHAAGLADSDGRLLLVREDVGRHNALDKLIGASLKAKIDPAQSLALITSRCSLEMVQKAAIAGFPILVSVSAPTAMAVRLAEGAGITLLAIARHDSVLILTHPQRILP